jgi:prophage tail gpP-like protein
MAGPLDAVASGISTPVEEGAALLNAVQVLVGKFRRVYDGWESIRIQRGMDQLAGTFSFSLQDKWRNQFRNWTMVPGEEVSVFIGGQPVIRGFIDSLKVSVKNDSRTMEVVGRDVTGDLVDTSISATAPAEYKLVTIQQLANTFVTLPFAIPVTFDTNIGGPFEKFTVKPGESPFDLLSRAAKLRGLLIQSTEIGSLNITNRQSPTSVAVSPTPLVQGVNILEAEGSYDYTDRFFSYTVKGQAQANDLFNRKAVSQVFGQAFDANIRPTRTKTIIADGSVDFISGQKLAAWEASIAAAKSSEVRIKVQGWKTDPLGVGLIWRPNTLVLVRAPFIGQQGTQMLIRAVQFNKSIGEGTTTDLELIRPDAYLPDQAFINPVLDTSQNLGWQFEVAKILGS